MSQAAFHTLEDHLHAADINKQCNRLHEVKVEAGLDVCQENASNPSASYLSPSIAGGEDTGFGTTYGDQALLVSWGSSFHCEYEDEDKSMWSNDFDYHSHLTSDQDDSNSNYSTESYAPSRNMFQTADKKGHIPKETLPGENLEGEMSEVVREMLARRRWVLLYWLLTWWIPSPFLKWFRRMKQQDALNIIIWFICACAVFMITVLGLVICPTQHMFNTSELASHSYQNDLKNVYTSIWDKVFDLLGVAATHERVVTVVLTKSVLQYRGMSADAIFPVQVCCPSLGRGHVVLMQLAGR